MFSDMVFPFNLVKQGARIVIYGAGNVGKCYYFQLKKTQFCKVVHWVDKKYEDYRFEGLDVEDVEGLRYWDDYDYIVVAVRETPVLEDVLKYLDNIKVSKKQIICWEPYYQEDWGYKTRLSLENILPPQNIDKSVNINSHESKIKVRILFEANTFWNVWEPLCKAYMSDERYDLCVIGWGDYKRKELLAYRENIPFVYDTDYDLKIDNPDIVFLSRFVNPSINLRELRKYSKLIVALWFGLMKWFGSVRRTLYSFEKTVELASPDFYIFDKYLYDEIANSEIENNGKYIFSGNTKFDYLYEKLHSPVKYPSEWGKIDDKCVFLIAPDHVWDGRNVTFDLYASEIFKYANENRNVAFILRMHPAYIEELLNNNIWTDTDIVNIKKYCLNSENLIWDDSVDYTMAYSRADAVMTDVVCGITISALVINKPIVILYRYDVPEQSFIPEYTDGLYNVRNREDFFYVINEIVSGKDITKKVRDAWFHKLIANYDGCNSLRIKEIVAEKYVEKKRNI